MPFMSICCVPGTEVKDLCALYHFVHTTLLQIGLYAERLSNMMPLIKVRVRIPEVWHQRWHSFQEAWSSISCVEIWMHLFPLLRAWKLRWFVCGLPPWTQAGV
jgi:hypothetical protein